ncbi:uncharacterized protein LOC123499836 isoform X2 [Portunus trituberculatus]|uniref:uncharacterized protein LOC123499836 isoform X2 n=1 Tax=Portunus trituberculatus TaxID=210409 RepID=UPI001E1CD54A|nr:uncharacterized protein LOC123499836 isoform X2 [Portunus trituberculatus]
MAGRSRLHFLVLVVVAAAAITPTAAAAAVTTTTTGGSPRNYIDTIIINALENLRNQMVDGWPDLGVPPLDPLDLGTVNIDINSGSNRVKGSLSDVRVLGLSSFNIDKVHSQLLTLKVDMELGIPLLEINGTYSITGNAGILPVYGDGNFRMDAYNFTLKGMIDLGTTEEGYFGVAVLDLDVATPHIEINFEGMMGGGEMGDFVNGILNSMAPEFLQSLEDQYMPLLEETIRHEINQILHGNSTYLRERDDSVNDYFDQVFANMRLSIIENGLDPIALPKDSDNFTITLFNQTLTGGVTAGPGKLAGLSTVHRAGNMLLLYVGEQDEVVWQGEVGLIDLQVDYRMGLSLPLLGKDLSLSAKMSFLHLSFETDVFLHQSDITFAYCNVTEMGPVHFKETGTGPLDTSLYNLVINVLLGELQGVVATTVQEVLCALLEGAFASG